jgi:hypothetical protein
MHLPGVRLAEAADLEIDDDEAFQTSMEKHQIDPEPLAARAPARFLFILLFGCNSIPLPLCTPSASIACARWRCYASQTRLRPVDFASYRAESAIFTRIAPS